MSTLPLNSELHFRLIQAFKEIKIVNTGQAGEVLYRKNPLYDRYDLKSREYELKFVNWGETYYANCDKCGDTRFRLCVSHLWNTKPSNCPHVVKQGLVKCHNENCDWSDLDEYLNQVALFPITRAFSVLESDKPRRSPMTSPGKTFLLSELPDDHPAVKYVRFRGFDPVELSAKWGVCYCASSAWKTPIQWSNGSFCCFLTPEDRLILPYLKPDGNWEGWQARWFGNRVDDDVSKWDDIPKESILTEKGVQQVKKIPKYLTMPGMAKSTLMWNLNRAAALSEGKVLLVSEGPLSMIASGNFGACTMGTAPSAQQCKLMEGKFHEGTVFFLAEDDAVSKGLLEPKIRPLQAKIKNGAHIIQLPYDQDAASLGHENTIKLVLDYSLKNLPNVYEELEWLLSKQNKIISQKV